ncbi:hypothetical protein [Streptomyces antimycoticus]|uniref:hypothetical protein n=1 Tax=Streptomyces antimycoticus TaxID=68175 RepID=UPI000A3B43F8|nr:hypothetical protein [Streptomyces antimycoticus]
MTTETPYTEDDLRAVAAAQHAALTEDPDFMGVGEQMDDDTVMSTEGTDGGRTWAELLDPDGDGTEAYESAQRRIHDLINGAADMSKWAVDLGADGLQPEDHTITLDGDGKPLVRLHLAFHPDMDNAAREGFAMRLARVMADAL